MLSCSTCGKTFQTQQSLNQHMAATAHTDISCNECGKGFYTHAEEVKDFLQYY